MIATSLVGFSVAESAVASSQVGSQTCREFGKAENLDWRSAIFIIIIAVTDGLMRQTPFTINFHNVHYKYHLYGAVIMLP